MLRRILIRKRIKWIYIQAPFKIGTILSQTNQKTPHS